MSSASKPGKASLGRKRPPIGLRKKALKASPRNLSQKACSLPAKKPKPPTGLTACARAAISNAKNPSRRQGQNGYRKKNSLRKTSPNGSSASAPGKNLGNPSNPRLERRPKLKNSWLA